MKIEANSPEEYIKAIPEERQVAFAKLRDTILSNLPKDFEDLLREDCRKDFEYLGRICERISKT